MNNATDDSLGISKEENVYDNFKSSSIRINIILQKSSLRNIVNLLKLGIPFYIFSIVSLENNRQVLKR